MSSSIPETDGYVKLSLLDGGSMTGSMSMMHAGSPPDQFRLYDWVFYAYNPKQDRHLVWDLGMAASKDEYPPFVHEVYWEKLKVTAPSEPVHQQITRRHAALPSQVDAVVFRYIYTLAHDPRKYQELMKIKSHAHFDHCRPIRDIFPNATGYFGPGTKEFCSPGHLEDPSSQWDGRFFDPINSTERWETLDGSWKPFGYFEKAMDFFGDGSFWIIQAPGHMPGNLCACARLETGEWILLGSDCCHSRSLLDGTHDFAEFSLPDGSRGCLHMDLPAAKDTIARLKAMESDTGVHIALAHDVSWMISGDNLALASLVEPEFLYKAQRMCPQNAIL